MRQSGLLKRQHAFSEDMSQAIQLTTRQFMVDTAQIALNRKFGFGFGKLHEFAEEWDKVRSEFHGMCDYRNPEADVLQEHMDHEFREICERAHEDPIPYAERYPYTKGIKYGRKK